ncbi:CLL_HP2_G0015740.mRNA.1.CDS.1 [Saccharomyces cerevisiae]|nr:CLL_HP2_G0015740.mRNA.1.CDS.1 [Saccharomyces cerevisiae]CAI6468486.1 CLL_HP2_G0015740.mRNA.1.CDS.1 [Saccharomyces cerevisiae]
MTPQLSQHDKIIAATPKRIYSNAHTYHINSISLNSDQETFLSADDLRINLWNLDIPDQSFNIVDIKPTNMEELTEVITSAEFHPQECNLFMYSSSKEITSSISDIKFSPNGRYIASRDYLTVKIWDVNMDNKPLKTINIHEQLKERLSDTYENDAIFDKFEVNFSGDSSSVMTGSYNNNFMIYPNVVTSGDNDNGIVKTFDEHNAPNSNSNKNIHNSIQNKDSSSSGNSHKRRSNGRNTGMVGSSNSSRSSIAGGEGANSEDSGTEMNEIVLQADKTAFRNKRYGSLAQRSARNKDWGDDIDFKKNILHFSWHPRENSIAVAATNNLFIFSAL